jgi:hypothetical protein
MNDHEASATLQHSLTAAMDSLAGVRMGTSLEEIVGHGRARRRRRVAVLAGAGAAVGGAAAAVALVAGGLAAPGPGGPVSAKLAAWTVATDPNDTITITIRDLRDPAGLRSKLRADGVPATITFAGHSFTPAMNPPLPSSCQVPALSDQANAELQGKIMPPPPVPPGAKRMRFTWTSTVNGKRVKHTGGGYAGTAKDSRPDVALTIRPSAIPRGIGLNIWAWAAASGTQNGRPTLDMSVGLVTTSRQCTGS